MPSDINYADGVHSKEFLTDSVLPSGFLWQVAMCHTWFVGEHHQQQQQSPNFHSRHWVLRKHHRTVVHGLNKCYLFYLYECIYFWWIFFIHEQMADIKIVMVVFSNVARTWDFSFSALKQRCYLFPAKFSLSYAILKKAPLHCIPHLFCLSVAVSFSRDEMLNRLLLSKVSLRSGCCAE